jgi:hypothetical protein
MTIVAMTLLLAAAAPCPGSTTREVEQCLAEDLARADAELNRYYAAAVRRLADDRQAATLPVSSREGLRPTGVGHRAQEVRLMIHPERERQAGREQLAAASEEREFAAEA